jgi:hypothetical protein
VHVVRFHSQWNRCQQLVLTEFKRNVRIFCADQSQESPVTSATRIPEAVGPYISALGVLESGGEKERGS